MLTYTEWKSQRQISESEIDVDNKLQQLVQATADQISNTIQSYLTSQGPLEKIGSKIGRGVDSVGRGIGSIGSAVGRGASAVGQQLTRPPVKDNQRGGLSALFTKQPGEENKGWFGTLGGRLKAFGKTFMMKKESVDTIFSSSDLREALSSYGIKELFLVEANIDFAKLNDDIKGHLNSFVQGLESLSAPTDNQVDNQVAQSAPTADSSAAPPVKKPSNVIEMARAALKNRKRITDLDKFFGVVFQDKDPTDDQKMKILRSLLRSLGFGSGKGGRKNLTMLITDILKTDYFPKEVKVAIKKAETSEISEPVVSEPEEVVQEPESRQLSPEELEIIKNMPRDHVGAVKTIRKLISNGTDPKMIAKINPGLKRSIKLAML
jgi:hypothetical protein